MKLQGYILNLFLKQQKHLKFCVVGEFALRLRHLEKSLLQALNDAKGKILDDDQYTFLLNMHKNCHNFYIISVVTTLETLKQEAAEVMKKADETELVMAEVEKTSAQYTPLAISCASLYFTLEQLNQVDSVIKECKLMFQNVGFFKIHFLYQYSLQLFMEIFSSVLTDNPHLAGVTDYAQRLNIITNDIFQVQFSNVSI